MKKLLAVFCLALIASCASFIQTSPHASADAICFNNAAPTPLPTTLRPTLGICNNNILGVQIVGSGGTPIPTAAPFPTATAGGPILVQPTNVPTLIAQVYHNSGGATLGVACDQSALVNSTTSGSTVVSLVPITFGLTTYICGYYLNVSVSAGATLTFEYGVHVSAACDTGPTALSGPIVLTSAENLQMGGAFGPLFSPGATREFCMVTTGTGTSIQGYVTFTKF